MADGVIGTHWATGNSGHRQVAARGAVSMYHACYKSEDGVGPRRGPAVV